MYYFIVNPNAKSKHGFSVWRELRTYLREKEIPYRVHMTSEVGDATRVVKRLTSRINNCTLIVLGGDGTLNEVLNGIRYPGKVSLGYIPVGSSNDFARGMGIKELPLVLLKRILDGPEPTLLDYGVACVDGQERRYLVSAGIGYDAAVCYETNYSKLKKVLNALRLGKLTYGIIALKQLIRIPLLEAELLMDGKTERREKLIFAATMIQPYEGGGVKFSPTADPTDGLMDVCIGSGIPKLRVLGLLPLAYFGKHVGKKGIEIRKCRSVRISMERNMYIHTDGEVLRTERGLLHSCAEFWIAEEKLRFLL